MECIKSNIYTYSFPLRYGQEKKLVRYLTEQPCNLKFCKRSCLENTFGYKLSDNVKSLVVLDTEYLLNYYEILELIDDIGFIISASSLVYSQFNYKKISITLKKLIEDPSKTVIYFNNETHNKCFITKGFTEEIIDYYTRKNYITADWYYNHIKKSIPVIFVTKNVELALKQFKSISIKMNVDSPDNVLIMNIKDFVNNYLFDKENVKELVESLEASLESSNLESVDKNVTVDPSTQFHEYLPDEIISGLLSKGDLLKGVIRFDKFKNQSEAFVVVSEENVSRRQIRGQSEILIMGSNCNRAIHGDVVYLQILPESKWVSRKPEVTECETTAGNIDMPDDGENESTGLTRWKESYLTPTGRVVGIYKRNWRDYVCCYEPSDLNKGNFVLVYPYDRRIPSIRVSVSNIKKLIDQRFVVRIDSWALNSRYPNGHYVETIGTIGDLETETKTLLIEYSLYNKPFTSGQLAELPINTPEQPYIMDSDEVNSRKDLRKKLIFSIDPVGCQDVDDALSISKLDDGGYELGVHIADVSYFVEYGSLLDMEARKRSTSIYLADRRFDMLPHVLSGDLCSLWSGVDRFAVSVEWQLDQNFDVVKVNYYRSIIRSKYKLAYELAQDIHDGNVDLKGAIERIPEFNNIKPEKRKSAFNKLKSSIIMLQALSNELKSRREAGGGLQLEGLEVTAQFEDEERTKLENLKPKEPLAMHETIAECMIFANHWVATRIYEAFPNRSCLRRHPPPRMDRFGELFSCAQSKGFTISTNSNLDLSKSLNAAVDKDDPEFNIILRSLATLAMSNAEYFSTHQFNKDEFYHYGLALPRYTHFTSPIRRYSDIVVHRLLLCALGPDAHTNKPIPESHLLSSSSLADQCVVMNHQHHQAQMVQRASLELFQALFFKNLLDKPEQERYMEGIIIQLRSNGFVVQVPRYGIRGSVHLKKFQGGAIAFSAKSPEAIMGEFKHVRPVEWITDGITLETVMDGNIVKLIKIQKSNEEEEYNLFDHVLLRGDINTSRVHGLTLQLKLLGRIIRRNAKSSEYEKTKVNLFDSVRLFDDEKLKTRNYLAGFTEGESIEKIISGLHSEESLHHLFYCLQQKLINNQLT